MELGELVEVAVPDTDLEDECPFSHEPPNDDLKNELGGIGSTLGSNMAEGKGIHKAKPPVGADYTKTKADPDPRVRRKALTSVQITVNGEVVKLGGQPLEYPLTCAAHHLIPAQEALKGHPVLKFMCKEGEPQDFRKRSKPAPAAVQGARVWGNVAYNVNGTQNGVWLPGNYAVGGGKGGVEIWKNRASDERQLSEDEAAKNWARSLDLAPEEWQPLSADPGEEEGPQPGEALRTALTSAARADFMLAGRNHHVHPGNPKWAYVKAAMDAAKGQFHDRHEPYSVEVRKYLRKVAEAYQRRYERSQDKDEPCKKCQKARVPAGANPKLVGPPYGIVGRLLAGSNFFKSHLIPGKLTAKNIYTSKWVRAWMDAKP